MEFNKESQEFVLKGIDMLALGAPSELRRWPITGIDHLIQEVAFADSKIDDIDASYFPGGASRVQIMTEQQKRRDALRQIRDVVSQHAITKSDLDELLDS